MTVTTTLGTWNNYHRSTLTLEQDVCEALGDFTADYNVDAIEADYRQAINAALPEGVSLNGDEFYGPYYEADRRFDGHPTDEFGVLDITAIIDSVDFWEIAARHDKTA
jgi:hypothetical protein